MTPVWNALRFIWRQTAALVALALIVVAFVAGWALRGGGDGGAEAPAGPVTAAPAAATVYTCSMHPQVRLPDADAKCPICFMDLIPVPDDDQAGEGAERRLVMTPQAMKLAEIQTTPVARGFPLRQVRIYGSIEYDETRIATIAVDFPGRLERLFVDYTGIRVKTGEHLAVIYSPELNVAHVELQQALASFEATRDAGEAIRRTAEAKLRAAREKLHLWRLTDEQIREMEEAAEPVEQMTIFSPISGVVISKDAVEGRYVRTGEEIYRVADLSKLWVHLEAYESQLPWLRYGQEVSFTTQSLPGRTFTGRISFIDSILDGMTRTVHVRVIVDNTGGQLKPGMFVQAVVESRVAGEGQVVDDALAGMLICPMHPEIVKDGPGSCDICGMPLVPVEELGPVLRAGDVEPPLLIPASAPLITGRRAVVYVRVPDAERPTFEGREVVLGPRAGDRYIVREGLVEGEDVVVHGAFKIDSAMQIAAKPSMMSAAPDEDGGPDDTTPLAVPETFLASLTPVYSAYFDGQEALAADKLAGFRQAAGDVQSAVELVDVAGLGGEALGYWRRFEKGIRAEAEHLTHLADLKTARRRFETYSTLILELEDRFGHAGSRRHYVTFCPMAFDNKGASWLARVKQVNNPYFGSSMLRCGTVRRELAPRGAAAGEGKP